MNLWIRRSLASGSGLALALCGGAWALAQSSSSATQSQAAPAQSQQSPAAQTNTPNTQAAAQPQTRTLQMVEVKAELQKTLDAKKAKQGEPVTAKLQNAVNIPNEQMLPKNTILEGHVDQTQVAPTKKGTSSVTVTFDKAKLKGGQELPIKATVVAISQPRNNMVPAEGGPAAGGAAPMAGAPAGGGAPGGTMAGAPGGGAAQPTPNQPMQTEPGYGANRGGGTVPNVQLKSDIHQHSSATFLESGKNVHVPDGTLMEVAVTIIPPGTRLQ